MDDTPNIREYLGVLRRHKWMIMAIVVLVIGAALTLTYLQPPVYSAFAQVLVQPIVVSADQTADPDALNLETEVFIATSPRVAEIVATELEEPDPLQLLNNLEVTVEPDTNVLLFAYTTRSAEEAQRRAQAFADAYVTNRVSEARDRLETSVSAIQGVLDSLQDRLDALNGQLAISEDPESETQLLDEIDTLSQQIVFERTRMLQLSSPANLQAAQVLYEAQVPSSPSNPTLLNSGLIGFFVGLFLGIGLAFLRDRLDDRLAGRADLEAAIGAPVLSVVPRVPAWKNAKHAYLVTDQEPHSVASEAYRTLRTAILFVSSQYDVSALLITSAHEQEGKSVTSANLAVVLGQAGKKVIVVSGDLRKPRLHEFFKVADSRKGLTNLLAGEASLSEVLVPVGPVNANVRMLPSGPIPGNPAELLGSDAMSTVMDQLRDIADFVIVDIAPVLAVADAMTMAPVCDGVLFVTDATKTSGGAVAQAREQLDQVGAHVIGGLLQNFDPSKSPAYAAHLDTPYAYKSESRSRKERVGIRPWSKAKG
jgi:capsular exopolysaccharide synthesis family protein